MMLSPAALSGELASALHAGTWRVGGQPATGLLPALCYLAEAILLVAVPRLSARLRSQEPFCEASNAWADRITVPRKFAFIDEPRAVRAFLEGHPDQAPTVLAPCAAEAVTRHARVTVHRCRGADSYLSIENISAEVDGQTLKESSAIVVACLRLPGIDPDALLRELESMASRPGQARAQEKAWPLAPQPAGALGHLDAGRLEPAFADAWPPLQATEAGSRTDASRLHATAGTRLGLRDETPGLRYDLLDDEPGAHIALPWLDAGATAPGRRRPADAAGYPSAP